MEWLILAISLDVRYRDNFFFFFDTRQSKPIPCFDFVFLYFHKLFLVFFFNELNYYVQLLLISLFCGRFFASISHSDQLLIHRTTNKN